MPAIQVAGDNRVIPIVRSVTPPGANATTTYIQRWPSRGKGTLRVWLFSNQAVTLNILQKPKDAGVGTFTMRQTDTRSVAASGTAMPFVFDVISDYIRIDVVATTAPTVFELEMSLLP